MLGCRGADFRLPDRPTNTTGRLNRSSRPAAWLSDRLPTRFAALTAAAEAAATGTRSHGLRFIDGEVSTTELVLVELRDGAPCAFGIGHLDKREAARLAGGPIADDVDGAHITGGCEQGLQIGFSGF